jgi:metal-responsive CopG/Arc/MetJ family transcriptional regulator
MRTIQITIDERLLKALDRDLDVKQLGRSAVLRRAAFDYLRRKRRREIEEEYRRAYARPDPESAGWTTEGSWPDE